MDEDAQILRAAGHELSAKLGGTQGKTQHLQQRLEELEIWKGYTDAAGQSASEVLQYITVDMRHLRRRLDSMEKVGHSRQVSSAGYKQCLVCTVLHSAQAKKYFLLDSLAPQAGRVYRCTTVHTAFTQKEHLMPAITVELSYPRCS
jgi:hypothetical protein